VLALAAARFASRFIYSEKILCHSLQFFRRYCGEIYLLPVYRLFVVQKKRDLYYELNYFAIIYTVSRDGKLSPQIEARLCYLFFYLVLFLLTKNNFEHL